MFRLAILVSVSLLFVPSACIAQDTTITDQTENSNDAAGITEEAAAGSEQNDANASVSDDLKLTFILVMFTNAVICGHWAINTGRNFWGWYIFGIFTGPFAGGCMLHRSACDKSGEANPGGAIGSIAGLGIPFAGFVIWIWLLS